MSETKFEIRLPEESVAPIYCMYDNQCQPQKAELTIDFAHRIIEVGYNPNIDSGCSMDAWNDREINFTVSPYLSYRQCEELVEYALKYLEENKCYEKYEDRWSGRNWTGNASDCIDGYILENSDIHQYIDDSIEPEVYVYDDWLEAYDGSIRQFLNDLKEGDGTIDTDSWSDPVYIEQTEEECLEYYLDEFREYVAENSKYNWILEKYPEIFK